MRFRVIPLEERILLDAAAVVDVAAVMEAAESPDLTQEAAEKSLENQQQSTDENTPSTEGEDDDSSETPPPPATEEQPPLRVLVLSSDVQNSELLKEATLNNIKVVYYNANSTSLENLLEKIDTSLNGRTADSIAFINYGAEGIFNLTEGIQVSLSNLTESEPLQNFWKEVGSHIKDGGSIDILACNVATIKDGVDLINQIEGLIGEELSVAASDDVTGHHFLGGDWDLEIGNVNADEIYFNGELLNYWEGTLDLAPYMVAEINPGGNAKIDHLIDMEGSLFFTAEDTESGNELWVTDGTEEGTYLVKDINESGSSTPENFVVKDDILYFTADDGIHGRELWRSDGTDEGTTIVTDLKSGRGSSGIDNLTIVGNQLFFSAKGNSGGLELYVSDGTAEGTQLVADIKPGGGSSKPTDLTAAGDKLFFVAQGDSGGRELYVSDGTNEGTFQVADIRSGNKSANIKEITAVGDLLFFRAQGDSGGSELWVSDGTEEGTKTLDVRAGNKSSNPQFITAMDGIAYFKATGNSGGAELWRSDGTGDGTYMVKDIRSGNASSNPSHLFNAEGTLFFQAVNEGGNTELWKSDGTEEGTILVKEINPHNGSNPTEFTSVDGIVYFSADNGTDGYELWRSDGTAGGTYKVGEINPGAASANPTSITYSDEHIYFTATDAEHGTQLWSFDLDTNAEAPTLATANASALEGSTIPLTISAGLVDTSGSEELTLEILNIPIGATITDGTFSFTASRGSTDIDVTEWNLSQLSITPLPNDKNDFELTVKATATEEGSHDHAITEGTIHVALTPVANVPSLTVESTAGNEDTPIPLSISANLNDPSEILTLIVSQLPIGSTLDDGTNTFTAGIGSNQVDISSWNLSQLTLTPPLNSSDDINLIVTASSTEPDNNDTKTVTKNLLVQLNPIADAPTLETENITTLEDTPAAIPFAVTLTDQDSSESLTKLEITKIPVGATLSDGENSFTATTNNTSIAILNWNLDQLTITPSTNATEAFTLTAIADSTESETGETASTESDILIEIIPTVEPPQHTLPVEVQTVANDIPLIFNDANGNRIQVSDPDLSPEAYIEVTLSVSSGTLSLSTLDGLSFSEGEGIGDEVLVLRGTLQDVNRALDDLEYTPDAQFSGESIFTISSSDLGDERSGGEGVTTDSFSIIVTATEGDGLINPVEIDPKNGSFTFSPLQTGQDGFTYQTEKGALISVTVSIEPLLMNVEKIEDPVQITSGDLEGANAALTRIPEKGTALINNDGSFSYTPSSIQSSIDFVGATYQTDQGVKQIRLIIQVIAPPKALEPTTSAAEVAKGLAQGALTFDPSSVTKMVVKHDDLGETKQKDEEEEVDSATTVAAFAIAAHEHDFPVGDMDLSSEESGDEKKRGFIKDAIQSLFGKGKGNDPGDISL